MNSTAPAVNSRELVRRGFRAIERPGSDDLTAPFAQNQSHWFRIDEGRLAEHWATRDDLGFLHQVGIVPVARVGAEIRGA